ncbi:MAG: copper amine oxidase N-terminal domain-containing protein [Clostridia bacterium]
MKKLLSVFMAVMLVLTMVCPALAEENEISVYLDAEKIDFDVKPQIINGRTMVPIRAIFEKMGAVVDWDGSTNTAVCTKDGTVVKMTVNSMDMYINNQITKMDVSPVVIEGRTLAPVRYVAEAFGGYVQWSVLNNAVVICSKDVYAYTDYPDIPDLGQCYNIPILSETNHDGYKVLTYVYSDMSNDDYYSYLYDNSALVLGKYSEVWYYLEDDIVVFIYTKEYEDTPRYYIVRSYDENDSMVFKVMIPDGLTAENRVTLYASDGRTIEVFESEVATYLNLGWYSTLAETQQTLYAPDGRTVTVFKSEVQAYRNAGWYETKYDAQNANKVSTEKNNSAASNNMKTGGVYCTPTGKRYHFDPDCGGKNSRETTLSSAIAIGLTPCEKCAK